MNWIGKTAWTWYDCDFESCCVSSLLNVQLCVENDSSYQFSTLDKTSCSALDERQVPAFKGEHAVSEFLIRWRVAAIFRVRVHALLTDTLSMARVWDGDDSASHKGTGWASSNADNPWRSCPRHHRSLPYLQTKTMTKLHLDMSC